MKRYNSIQEMMKSLKYLPLKTYYTYNKFQRCSRMPKCRGSKNKELSNVFSPIEGER